MKASDRVSIQGKPIDRLTKERYTSLNMLVKSKAFGGEKSDITVIQAIGGAAASAGTHVAPGGSLDLTWFNVNNRCRGDRLLGGAGWPRPTLKGVWQAHYHTVTAGVGYAPASARRQVTAMYAGKNGLANNGADTGPNMLTRPLFVAPWTDRGKRGVYYTKKAVTGRAEGTSKAKSTGTIPKGAKFTVIGIVNVNGTLWAINVDGKHVPKNDLTVTKPAPVVAKIQRYTVAKAPCYGRIAPGINGIGKKAGAVRQIGFSIYAIGYNDTQEGRFVVTNYGTWYAESSLKKVVVAPPVILVKPMTLRPMSYNLPGSDKLPNAPERAKAGVALVKTGNPDFVGLQELIGTGKDLVIGAGKQNKPCKNTVAPSAFAKSVAAAYGSGYQLLVPTTAWNENYGVIKIAAVTLVTQYPDAKLYAKSGGGGRHMSRWILKDVASGIEFGFGITHLSDTASTLKANPKANAEEVRQEQSELGMAAITAMCVDHGNAAMLKVILGDMNTGALLRGYLAGGLQALHIGAAKQQNGQYETHATISDDTPNKGKPIDQIYASKQFTMQEYNVLLGLDKDGTWPKLRPSDHVPIVGAVAKG